MNRIRYDDFGLPASPFGRRHREKRLSTTTDIATPRRQRQADTLARCSLLCALTAVTALAGCGGGGGGSTPPPPPPPPANQSPVAVAKLSGEAVLGAATNFDITGTADPDGTIATRSWAYGDGQTGSANNHVYMAAGSFTATLTVTDNGGATASTTVPVTVAKCSVAGTADALRSPFPTVCMQTTMGEMVIEVYPTQAPVTTNNFLTYVQENFYNGLIYHRVIADFVVQAGGYLPGLAAKTATHGPIVLESNLVDPTSGRRLQNFQYTVAMARTDQPNSATSQFFVNLVDNHTLDYNPANSSPNGYAVFGQVISGTAVVDAMGRVPTGSVSGFDNVPLTDVVIRSVVRLP